MSRGARATMRGDGEKSPMERRYRPAVMKGEAVMPASAAVKGSARARCAPLTAAAAGIVLPV